MTPQQLLDLPGAGEANKRVKAMGMWRETMTDSERIEWIEEYNATIKYDIHGYPIVKPTRGELWDVLRPAIDEAARKQTSEDYTQYLED